MTRYYRQTIFNQLNIMVHNVDKIGLCHICRNFLRNLFDVAYMSSEVSALPFQANANYGTLSIEFASVLKYELQQFILFSELILYLV